MPLTIVLHESCAGCPAVQEFIDSSETLFDVYSRDPDADVGLIVEPREAGARAAMIRGKYVPMPGRKYIYLFRDCIEDSFRDQKVLAGNNTIAPNLTIGLALVFRHEIQHLNQDLLSGRAGMDAMFRRRSYAGRPGEVDARASVDKSYVEICRMFEAEPLNRGETPTLDEFMQEHAEQATGVDGVVELLAEYPSVTHDHVRAELVAIHRNNPVDYAQVVDRLLEMGVEVRR
jgi:hypothetical protein